MKKGVIKGRILTYHDVGWEEERIAEKLKISRKDAGHAVERIFQEMSLALASDGEVDISGFGKFIILIVKREWELIQSQKKE